MSLKINETYARAYEERKRREELLRHPINGGEDDDNSDSSSLSSEDSSAEELTPQVQDTILNTIRLIRDKDPRIYDESFRPFDELKASPSTKPKNKKPVKKITYRDVMREGFLREGETAGLNDDVDVAVPPPLASYNELNEAAKQELSNALKHEESSDDEDDEFFVPASKPRDETDDIVPIKRIPNALSRSGGGGGGGPVVAQSSTSSSKTKESDDDFLWRFVEENSWRIPGNGAKPTQRRRQPQDDDDGNSSSSGEDSGFHPTPAMLDADEDLERDHEELERAEEFETRFNFRFEEPDASMPVPTHARNMTEGSVRREDDSRKQARERRRERKDLEKQQKLDELRRLKNMKRKMMQDELAKAAEGVDKEKLALHITPEDMEEDFDPDTWDAKMAKIFNDEYYEQDDEEMPVEEENKNVAVPSTSHESAGGGDDDNNNDDVESLEPDEDGFVFRYRRVPKLSFGLTTDEILTATPALLNSLVPLKTLAPYREQTWSVSAKQRKRFKDALKRQRVEDASSSSVKKANKKRRIRANKKAAGTLLFPKFLTDRKRLDAIVAENKRKKKDAAAAAAEIGIGQDRLASYMKS